ncbi:MAG: phosphotransferase family protein [Planctomycetota bacterium]|nr:MAG: phosphotransferase family protein [Planctomycetota bacterium]
MSSLLDTTKPVRQGEELDVEKLESYLLANLPDTKGPLVVEQFPGGASNLTYLVRLGELEMVLRRPPFGNRVKSAHDMGREYRVLSKLHKVYAPAPQPYLYCEDESVLGAPFYCMERRHGVVLRRKLPEGIQLDPDTLARLNRSFVDNLVAFHKIDYEAAGLGDLGKPVGFVERQVGGWAKRYVNARTEDVPEMEFLMEYFPEHMPKSQTSSLVHNDYKFDNLMLDPDDLTKIVAVLDWEMCTLGDPLMDLGTVLSYWVEAKDPPPLQLHAFGPTQRPGSMTRRELTEYYGEKSGFDTSDALFYYTFGLFKTAVIVQQIYYRYAQGFTKDERFAQFDKQVVALAQEARRALEEGTF